MFAAWAATSPLGLQVASARTSLAPEATGERQQRPLDLLAKGPERRDVECERAMSCVVQRGVLSPLASESCLKCAAYAGSAKRMSPPKLQCQARPHVALR